MYQGRLPTERKICAPSEGSQPANMAAEAEEEGNTSWNPQEVERTGAKEETTPGTLLGVGEEVCNSQRDKKFKILVIAIDVTPFKTPG